MGNVFAKKNTGLQNAKLLKEIYNPGYEFPEWTLDLYKTSPELFRRARGFYLKQYTKEGEARQLLQQREPVNIAMHRYYDTTLLKRFFGYSIGAYHKLQHNVAVYVQTPVWTGTRNCGLAHVICLIGAALDNPRQPDYMRFCREGQCNLQRLRSFYLRVWTLAFRAARYLGLPKLQTSVVVGGGAFAGPLPDFKAQVHDVVIQYLHTQYPDIHEAPAVHIPSGLCPHADEQTLYVNAWDPWSIPGNGNAQDNSLDGFWGRSSAIAVLGWPLANPHLKIVGF